MFNADEMRSISKEASCRLQNEIIRAETCIKFAAKNGKRMTNLGFTNMLAYDVVNNYLIKHGFTTESCSEFWRGRPGLRVTW